MGNSMTQSKAFQMKELSTNTEKTINST